MDADGVGRFDRALGERLASGYPEPLAVPHRVFVAVGRKGAVR
jgi:hypothetical protein